MSMTIQTGIKRNTKDMSNFCYWLNGVDVTDQNLDQFTPYIQGVSRIFVHKLPNFLANVDDGAFSARFKALVETGFTRIDGIQDTNVEFADFEGGFGGQKFSNVSLASNDTDTLSITVYEQSGSPLREYLDMWVTGVRDIKSNIAHYHGLMDENGSQYSERNHTAEFIYCALDPTGKQIEYACMFAHAFPTKVPKNHLNYESRNRGNVPMEMEFRAQLYESPAINAIANYYLLQSQIDYNYLSFTPNIKKSDIAKREYAAGNTIKDNNYEIPE